MDNVVNELAAYFTGPAVAGHSMGLSQDGSAKLLADQFFRAREALGIRGYAKCEEAKGDIRRAFGLAAV